MQHFLQVSAVSPHTAYIQACLMLLYLSLLSITLVSVALVFVTAATTPVHHSYPSLLSFISSSSFSLGIFSFIFFILFFIFIYLFFLLFKFSCLHFPPTASPHPAHPHLPPLNLPALSMCPIHMLTTLPLLYPVVPFLLPPGDCQFVLYFNVSGYVLLACLFC